MGSEFTHSEVVCFLNNYALFTLNLSDRAKLLYENGVIDEQSQIIAKKQGYNAEILESFRISPLFRNKYLESKVKELTGNNIKIIDHNDNEIEGTPCNSCGYVVFENHEDSIFEICPVCGWQSDKLNNDGYSKLNDVYLSNFVNTPLFSERVLNHIDIYMKKDIIKFAEKK